MTNASVVRSGAGLRHAFCIPAFGEAPFLEKCIESLLAQTARVSSILVCTSTPNERILGAATRFGLEVRTNPAGGGIAPDWNFALTSSDAELVTIAHQDDLFAPNYVSRMLHAFNSHPDAVIAFSDYQEHDPDGPREANLNHRVKRMLTHFAFLGREAIRSPLDKRRLLCLGNPICCPSVVINRARVPDFRFASHFRTNLDWDAWLCLADKPGAFVQVPEPLISKGIHPKSETSVTIADSSREREDRQMLERFWPRPLAAVLMKAYRLSYRGNRV